MRSLKIKEIIEFARIVRNLNLAAILDVPKDVHDSESVRKWVWALSCAGDVVAKMTSVKFDDDFVGGAQKIISDDRAWAICHNLVCDFVDATEYFTGQENRDVSASIQEAADIVGIAPALFISIVQAVISLLSFLRK